ncbi:MULTISPECIES: ArsR/SmtB family transcription factor [Mucilaginibacter]|uniref:Helix-turn-helix transcriptional regulator n=1 Tax=Mucilaginibacter rubeus TaxID=2027860 RepID=A0A5C1HXW1_9SPHI|nr:MULTISPECIES: metalloregulator ArsR/SmtB family transcription factor [Mucilaginibacter]QEM10515.1 helix-turn-helix transcriptional regulator [Mucilaginibacter rubeus]
MANHKKAEFAATDQDLSMVAKALSHPARIAIMRILAQHKHFTCGEIVEILPLAQPTVSHHLKELMDARLITVAIDGKKSLYDVNWPTWNRYTAQFENMLSAINNAEQKVG